MSRLLKYTDGNRNAVIAEAGAVIRRGGTVIYPTETLYGIGADAMDAEAVGKVMGMKGRPAGMAVPVIVADRDMLMRVAASITKAQEMLMERFWPGPLTILFDASDKLPVELTAETGTVAVRIPGFPVAADISADAGRPITATSANPSGVAPSSDPDEIAKIFGGKADLVVDAGTLPESLPSTLVDVRAGMVKILRQGSIRESDILDCLKR